MPERFSRSSVRLDVTVGESPSHEVPEPDTPFQLLVVGDFSGRANRGLHAPLASRRPMRVDCDNLDDTISAMGVALDLPEGTLRFQELDDFHPDRIYQKAEPFRKLEDSRDRPPREDTQESKPAVPSAKRAEPKPGMSLLDQMMEQEEATAPAPSPVRASGTLSAFIEQAVAPHLVRSDSRKQQWSAQVDAMATEKMRAVLHHPEFQAVEAAWRGVQLLVRRLDPDHELRIWLLDATLAEVLDDPQAFVDCLSARPEPWALIAGNFAFGQSPEAVARLRNFGRIAAALRAPFLAEGQPPSEAELSPDWVALRKSAEARFIGLALPRILLRLPYGTDTSPLDSFAFEEMPQSVHVHYLWGNPAFACASLVGEAFRSAAWNLRPGRGQIDGLPLHVYKEDGEAVAKPCAEVLLTERDAEFLLDQGLIPVASMKNQDAVLVLRIQSISDPVAALAGRWG